ncbi:MAG: hypothetical protein K0U98_10440 [Deltaproteobacteria bacterium]|nr:hypothetical protein [Deltaproteobacteria bacterium]
MSTVERLGYDEINNRDLYLIDLATADELPGDIPISSDDFACFLAWDSGSESVETIVDLAEIILDAGCAYLCAWGDECERVHDIFDEVEVGGDPDPEDKSVVMTTWHDGESLDEGLWFFLNCTWPDDHYFENCRAAIVISIGGKEAWLDRIRFALEHPYQFNRQVLDHDEDESK